MEKQGEKKNYHEKKGILIMGRITLVILFTVWNWMFLTRSFWKGGESMNKNIMALVLVTFVVVTFGACYAQATTSINPPTYTVPFYGTDTARTYEGFVTANYKDVQWGPLVVVDTKDKGAQKFFITSQTQWHPSCKKIRDGVYVIVKSDEFNHAKYIEVLPFVEWQNRTGWKK
jgi:hypothetical protein